MVEYRLSLFQHVLKLFIAQTVSLQLPANPFPLMTMWPSSLICIISRYGNNLSISSSLYLLLSHINPSQILSIQVTQYFLTDRQSFLFLLPPNHRNKYSASCIHFQILNWAWLHCPEADPTHYSRKTKRNTGHSCFLRGAAYSVCHGN